jgi:hypothetical protein
MHTISRGLELLLGAAAIVSFTLSPAAAAQDSHTFETLPQAAKGAVYARLFAVLSSVPRESR